MGKKLQAKDFERIIGGLPAKEQAELRAQDPSPAWLRERIAQCEQLMRRDAWVGPIWLAAYTACMFWRGFDSLTASVFAVGALYFGWSLFTTGSYGANRRRAKVYRELLSAMGEQP